MATDAAALLRRYETLKAQYATHFMACDRMAPYLAPSRVGIVTPRSPGQSQTMGVMDSTMMSACELFAFFMAGHAMNPAQRWGEMRMKTPAYRTIDALREWHEDSRDRMLATFATSAFYGEGQECTIDWSGFGTGCLMADESPAGPTTPKRGFRGMHFAAHKTGRFVTSDGPNGMADTLFYEVVMSAHAIEARWGRAALPEKILRKLQDGKPDEPFTLVHAITPRSERDQTYAAGNQKMPWASCWIEKSDKALVYEGGYRRFPAAIPRYLRTPGEPFGRGRGQLAFPDTWTLNEAKSMAFQDWTLKIQPPILVRHDATFGSLRLTPNAPNVVNTHGRSIADSIAAWQTGSHPEVSQIKEEELRKSIREIFFTEHILKLLEVNKSEMTATEFSKKMDLLFRIMGTGVYGRYEQEFLRPVWDITFHQMYEAGALAPLPPEIEETDGDLETVFENPIAKAQRTTDVDAILLSMQDLLPLAQAFPTILDRIDPDKTTTLLLSTRGYPASGLRNDEELEAFRDAKQQQHEQEAALAQAGQVAEAGGKIAPLLTAMQGGHA
jgi:hypothetical protein